MKAIVERINAHPRYSKVLQWSKLIAVTGSTQVIVQLLGLGCGIMIIRLLPTKEYAFYTLANSILGAMAVLSDSGISIAVTSEGGKVWQDRSKLGKVLVTGLFVRRKFAIYIWLAVIPIFAYLLRLNNAGWATVIFLIISIIPSAYAAMTDSLFEIVPKLHQDIKPLQSNQFVVGLSRFVLSISFLFFFPWPFIAILMVGLPRIYGNLKLKRIVAKFADLNEEKDRLVEASIVKVLKRTFPGAIYYCFSGQVSIWLISFFGNTTSIAEIGALGRIGMIFSFISILFSTLLIPRFARMQEEKSILLKKTFQIIAALILVFVVIGVLLYHYAFNILWILGPSYRNLQHELWLCYLGAAITILWNMIFAMSSSRAWLMHPFPSLSLHLLAIIIGVLIFQVSTLEGVLKFNIFIACVELVMHGLFMAIKLYKVKPITKLG